ncbi:protein of unknown function [Nitrospina watsonii]|uniref:Uncharacterized protein n=1 Tax=Nitrospina watsonii TaxID=1323948 RepID=A0ABN8W292_9BACT|nr:protein of unknown function [Nitrospina watsonii]
MVWHFPLMFQYLFFRFLDYHQFYQNLRQRT